MDNLTIWIAVSKSGAPLLFTDEPVRRRDYWVGTYYVNSAVYDNILALAENANMSFDNDPEPLILEITKHT